MIIDFSTHYFDLYGKSWMAHGRAWPHGSISMILNHNLSMMSHVENFIQSRKFACSCQFSSLALSIVSELHLNDPGRIKDAFRHRVS